MFTRLLYFDKERVIEYNAIISKDDFVEFDEIDILDSTEGTDGVGLINGTKGIQKNKHGKIQAASSRLWNTFSENLEKSDAFVDFLDEENSIDAVGRGCIIRMESEVQIPEEFDTVSLLNAIPHDFLENQLVSEIDDNEKDVVKAFFKFKKASLPIIFQYNEKLLCSKLKNDCFLCTDQEFEDCIEEDLIIVAKVLAPNRSKNKELFNPLKDLFVLNRAARRALDSESIEGLENIYADSDYMYLEILAIYQ